MGSDRSLKQRLRSLLLPSRLMSDLEALRLTQGRILVELNRSKSAHNLQECEFSICSQWGEDGIIQKLVAHVPITHRTFIEFGVEDFSESNCRFLMMNDNWRGYVLDGSERWIAKLERSSWWWKFDLRARCAIVTRDNVNALLEASGFDRDLGILSIDVDGMDYWLLETMDSYAPRIMILEYNALFGCKRKISVPYDASFERRQQHYSELYYGASLPALTHLASRKGYSLVCTGSAGVNAFFVRNDLIGGDVSALAVEEAFAESMVRQSRDRAGGLNYLDREARYEAIKGMPVVNVETGEMERL
jgi:hypothetical protein